MAESDVQREGQNESRLRQERLASSRTSGLGQVSPGAGGETPPPTPLDAGPVAPKGGFQQTDEGTVSAALRQQRLENQLNLSRRDDQQGSRRVGARDAADAALAGMDMARAATMPARATPAGAAAGAGLDAAGGGAKAAMMAAKALQAGGIDKGQVRQTVGRGCVKMLWQNLWLTFGHSVYFLAIIFLTTSQSKFARKWFPRMGEEWFPPELLNKIPSSALIPIKLAELLAVLFIMFWVLLLDLTCIGLFALMLGIILSAADFV